MLCFGFWMAFFISGKLDFTSQLIYTHFRLGKFVVKSNWIDWVRSFSFKSLMITTSIELDFSEFIVFRFSKSTYKRLVSLDIGVCL